MNKILGILLLSPVIPVVAQDKEIPANRLLGLWNSVETFGAMGAMTADATLGELIVRAFPSREIVSEWFQNLGKVKLSCDTYRTGQSSKLMAAATYCHVEYRFEIIKGKYTLTGPFKQDSTYSGRSCEQARKECGNYSDPPQYFWTPH